MASSRYSESNHGCGTWDSDAYTSHLSKRSDTIGLYIEDRWRISNLQHALAQTTKQLVNSRRLWSDPHFIPSNGNVPGEDTIIRSYLNFQKETFKELEDIQTSITKLMQRQIAALDHFRQSCQILRSTISVLPVEVLATIFEHCRTFRATSVQSTPMALSLVCTQWREVALSTPELWSCIRNPARLWWTRQHLRYSRKSLLDFFWTYPLTDENGGALLGRAYFLDLVCQLELVKNNIHRIRTLDVDCDWGAFGTDGRSHYDHVIASLPDHAPVLERLSLEFYDHALGAYDSTMNFEDDGISTHIFTEGAPRLTSIKLSNVTLTSACCFITNIVKLDFNNFEWDGNALLPSFLNMLREMPNLTSLNLQVTMWECEYATYVTMPSLKELILRNSPIYWSEDDEDDDEMSVEFTERLDTLFYTLRAPRLETLSLQRWSSDRLRRAFDIAVGKHLFCQIKTLEIATDTLEDVWTANNVKVFIGVKDLRIFASNAYSEAALPINSGDIRQYLVAYNGTIDLEYFPNLDTLTLGPFSDNWDDTQRHSMAYSIKSLCFFIVRRRSYKRYKPLTRIHVYLDAMDDDEEEDLVFKVLPYCTYLHTYPGSSARSSLLGVA